MESVTCVFRSKEKIIIFISYLRTKRSPWNYRLHVDNLFGMAYYRVIVQIQCLLMILCGMICINTNAKPISTPDPPVFGERTRAYFAHKIAPFLVAYGKASISETQPHDPSIL